MPNVTEFVYRELRRAIIISKLKPGQRLQIMDCSERYGVSATPVREALQKLAKEGLVSSKPHAGFSVTQHTLKQLRDMFRLRNILELSAIELAAGKINEKQITQLDNLHSPFTGYDEESVERYMDENRYFHYLVAHASGNEELAEMVGHMLDKLGRYMVLFGEDEKMAKNHARIVDYLRQHDVEGSKCEMAKHLELTNEFVIDSIIKADSDDWQLSS